MADPRRTVFDCISRIAPDADVAALADDDELQDRLDLDSMDFLNIVIAVHEATGIEIPERDYSKLATLGGFVDYVAARLPSA